ncbi:MAG: penicillin-binding protein [Actinomyces sp.]|nr:transglycosylase domain-containing protein [Actinomyces sp.]MCI1788188.1 penicillin-binding protein [Actinomyces sp.]MCI1830081.1 penicillin-binding protein [Actinomyces sp.]
MASSDGKMDWDQVMTGRSASPGGGAGRGRSGSRSRSASAGTGSASRRGGAGRAGRGGRPKRSIGRRIGLGIVFTFLSLVILGLGAFVYLYMTLSVPAADEVALAQTTKVYYSDGTTEMGSLSEVNRTIIDASTLPGYVGEAVVASEDRTFFTNSGVDFKGIARALVNNVTTGSRQGGSTLSQQYVERYYMGETTSYTGKIKEAVLAVKINRSQTKDEILGNYMNTIYFGRGAYGIEAASQAYFGHPAKDLTLSESALLAGIIPAPSAWDPAVDAEEAQQRWGRVLDLMVEDGWISQSDADAATFPETVDPASLTDTSNQGPTGYLITQVRNELANKAGLTDEQIDTGGLTIVTTIDKAKQDAAVQAAETMTQVSGWDPSTMHTALSSVDPATGEILAEYAGADYQTRQQNAVTQDRAAAGSTFKVFALLAHAMDGGTIYDAYNGASPQYFNNLTDPVTNDGLVSYGTVDLLKATAYSINTAFVALNEEVGPATTEKVAIDAGMPENTEDNDYGLEPTLLNVLGFAAPHNIDITRAYATIVSGGLRTDPHIVREVRDSGGSQVYGADTEPTRVFQAEDVAAIMPALEAVMEPGGTGEKAAVLGRTVAGKTGTSEQQMSAQFVGAVPQMVTTVSMYQSGPNGEQVPLADGGGIGGLDQFHGGDWPAQVWVDYMQVATQGMENTDFTWMDSVTPRPAPTPTYTAPPPTQTPTPEPTTEQPTQTPTPEPTTEQPTTPTDGGGDGGTGGGDDGGGGGDQSGRDSGT